MDFVRIPRDDEPGERPWTARDIAMLERIQRRVLWLSTYLIHYANTLRANPDGTKVGGHQASSSSVVSLLTALYFKALRPGDRISIKPHASPVFHAIQALRGKLPLEHLLRFREVGGLQAYPSRTKDADEVDFSTGSVGLGAVAPLFGALTQQYVLDHLGEGPRGRYIALVGDAELDEGNVWEAMGEEYVKRLSDVVWVVDLNRQSLDRVVPEGQAQRIREMFRVHGWHVINLKYGGRLQGVFARPGGQALCECIDEMDNAEYQTLLTLDGEAIRAALLDWGRPRGAPMADLLGGLPGPEVKALFADLAGHDLRGILQAFAEADRVHDRPVVIVAYTIKGWGLPIAGDPLNHSMLLTAKQIAALRAELGVPEEEDLAGFPEHSEEGQYIRDAVKRVEAETYRPPAGRWGPPHVPARFNVNLRPVVSTQEALGVFLQALASEPDLARFVVTVSPDVAVSTNLAGWINKRGIYADRDRPDYFAERQIPRLLKWKQSPRGQHIELGISENTFFMVLAMLGLAEEFTGTPLVPVGTLYDPFISRGLDAFVYGAYSNARFILAGTPSGLSLSREGGMHQSLITPAIGVQLPNVVYFEPAFAQELEWILLGSVASLVNRRGGRIVYLRLSTKPVDQRLLPIPGDPDELGQLKRAVLAGGHRLIDYRQELDYEPGRNVANLFAVGAMVPEAVEASRALAAEGTYANLIVVTSPDLLYRAYRDRDRLRLANPQARVDSHLDRLVPRGEQRLPAVTVMDGHSHTLAFLGAALGTRVVALGVDEFGQSGERAALYRRYGIDTESIARAVRLALKNQEER
jgi:pyruvate dehydrogenase E1 component